MCASVAIVINKWSHLSDRVCNSCGRKVKKLFQLFNLVKNSTKEENVQSPDRFKRQLQSSVSPSLYRGAITDIRDLPLVDSTAKTSSTQRLHHIRYPESVEQPRRYHDRGT
jgi:ABC-type lipoprotein export system ATPase subunit